MQDMNVLLVLLIVAAVVATVVALIRGIISFLKETEADLKGGVSPSGLRQNRMMMARVMFQAIAVLLVAVLLLLNR